MKKKLFSLVIFLGVLATFFIGAEGCKGKKDKSSSSAQTTSGAKDNAAPPTSKK